MILFDISRSNFYIFNNKLSVRDFSTNVPKPFSIKWGKTEKTSVSFLDSFDGRLFNAGYTVVLFEQNIYIKSTNKKDRSYIVKWPNSNLPKFASDISNPQVQKLINSLLDVRSLTKTLSLNLVQKSFTFLNNDLKTIARGVLILSKSIYPNPNTERTVCLVQPLRGYTTDVKMITSTFPSYKSYPNFGRAMLNAYKIDLKDYSKPRYALANKKNISQALYEILQKNYLIIRKNEQGIIDDIDIEFLHDYRVSCRRMRSALSLIKNVLDPVASQMLRIDLKHIGRFSGPLRDLDVYLLREDEYKSLLPNQWPQKDIHAIFVKLRSRRKQAYNKMVKMLKSPEYIELTKRWEDFLKNFEKEIKTDAPLLITAAALIMKWYKRVIKDGKLLSAKDSDEKFHNLRITCKKLRYLLEFFGPLYPEPLIRKAVKQLKKLQENLGDFNDYSVQIETLNNLLTTSASKQLEFVKTIAGLITVLDYKMHQLRDEFYTLFDEFSSAENTKLYKQLFGAN